MIEAREFYKVNGQSTFIVGNQIDSGIHDGVEGPKFLLRDSYVINQTAKGETLVYPTHDYFLKKLSEEARGVAGSGEEALLKHARLKSLGLNVVKQ